MPFFVAVGPKVNVITEHIYAYDDLSAEIQCLVQAYPEPKVEWYYRQSANMAKTTLLSDTVVVKKASPNHYLYTLIVRSF